MSSTEKRQVSLYLPMNIYDKIRELSERFGLTVNGYIKSVLADYLLENNFMNEVNKNGQRTNKNYR